MDVGQRVQLKMDTIWWNGANASWYWSIMHLDDGAYHLVLTASSSYAYSFKYNNHLIG